MKVLTDNEITSYLKQHLKNWKFDGDSINREFKFKNFVQAFSFMTAVAFEAEKLDHHPDWSNAYNKVSISLSTHSPEGLTQLDLDLAGTIDQLFLMYEKS
jgi:4a-hydroxytetrahydrobiopterin dehydratase